MARTSLPPGFRFHPTDVELVMYYLKRMVMGKKFRFEAIAEVNINNFSPWDLPDKSCVRSKDLEWFFFCPREKKYSSGTRVKRATENGYWKTTGKDRPIHHNGKLVGTVKTLIFHLGHAPRGERTDWVLHEYRILDDKLAAAGVQDTYVLCKVFKKNGPGPKNGAQYGAPFNEADWTDDEDDAPNHAISVASDGPSPTTQLQAEEQTCPITDLSGPGNKSGVSVINDQSTSSAHPTSDVFLDKTEDEMDRLLAQFTDDDMMLFHGSGVNQGDLSGKGKSILLCSDGYDIFNGLSDLDAWPQMNEDRLDSLRMHNDNYFLENNLFLDNSGYIELNDLLPSLDSQIGFTENAQSSTGDPFRPLHENIQQLNSGAYSAGIDQYAAYSNQLPMRPQTVNDSLYQGGSNAAYDLDFVLGPLVTDMDFAQCIERGSRNKIVGPIPARSPSAALSFLYGCSSMHIKAEVTHRAGECTNEAFSVMMGGSSNSCRCTTLPLAVFQKMRLLCCVGWFHHPVSSLVGFSFVLIYSFFIKKAQRGKSSFYYHYPNEGVYTTIVMLMKMKLLLVFAFEGSLHYSYNRKKT